MKNGETGRVTVISRIGMVPLIGSLVAMLVDKHSFYDHLKYQYTHAVLREEKQ